MNNKKAAQALAAWAARAKVWTEKAEAMAAKARALAEVAAAAAALENLMNMADSGIIKGDGKHDFTTQARAAIAKAKG